MKKKRATQTKMDYSDVRVATAMQATGIVVPVETERLCTLTSTVIVEHLHYDARLRRLRRDYAEDDDAPHVPKGAVLSRVEVSTPPRVHVALRTRASGILLVIGDADGCRDMRCVHVADDSDLVLLGDEGAATARLVYTLYR